MLEETLTFFYLFDFIPVSVTSIVDILIVAFVFYQLLGLIRGTRAAQMLVGPVSYTHLTLPTILLV